MKYLQNPTSNLIDSPLQYFILDTKLFDDLYWSMGKQITQNVSDSINSNYIHEVIGVKRSIKYKLRKKL